MKVQNRKRKWISFLKTIHKIILFLAIVQFNDNSF